MTRYMLAILPLPLAFVVGCGPTDNADGNGGNTECTETSRNDCVDGRLFSATLRSIAPYGWVGDHRIFPVGETSNGPDCEDVNECGKLVDHYGNYRITLHGDTWDCVNQEILVGEPDEGETVSVSDAWLDEGTCYLAPEGEYSGMDVRTIIDDENGLDQGWIGIESWAAVITGSTFIYDGDYLLEGTVSDDLSSITFHLEWGDDQVDDVTINLED